MLILESPWTRQPQVAVGVDWDNPISRGLVFLFDGQESDAVGRRVVDITNTAGRGIGVNGRNRSFNGDAAVTQVSFNARRAPTSVATMVCLAYCTNNTATNTLMAMPNAGVSNTYVLMDISGTEANDPVRVITYNTGTIGLVYGSQPSGQYLNRWVLFGGTSLNGTNNKIHIDGAPVTPSSTAGSSVALGAMNRYDVGCLNTVAPSNGLNGNVAFAAIWDRVLTDAEHAALFVNPWQLFAPQQILIPTPAAAASAPTITALSAIGITATSAQPRISYS